MAGRILQLVRHLRERTKRHFITGLLVIVPLSLTWYVLASLVKWMDRVLAILPVAYRPESWLPFPVPGLGVILTLIVIQFVGIMGANLIGRSFVRELERLLRRIPVVRGIYGSVQQMLRQLVVVDENKYHKVVLMRYPGGEGLYRIGFVTGARETLFRRQASRETPARLSAELAEHRHRAFFHGEREPDPRHRHHDGASLSLDHERRTCGA